MPKGSSSNSQKKKSVTASKAKKVKAPARLAKRKYKYVEEKSFSDEDQSQGSSPSMDNKRVTKKISKESNDQSLQSKRSYNKFGKGDHRLYDSRVKHFQSQVHQKHFDQDRDKINTFFNDEANMRKYLTILDNDRQSKRTRSTMNDDHDHDQEPSLLSSTSHRNERSYSIHKKANSSTVLEQSQDSFPFISQNINHVDRVKQFAHHNPAVVGQEDHSSSSIPYDPKLTRETQNTLHQLLSFIQAKPNVNQGISQPMNMMQSMTSAQQNVVTNPSFDAQSHPSLISSGQYQQLSQGLPQAKPMIQRDYNMRAVPDQQNDQQIINNMQSLMLSNDQSVMDRLAKLLDSAMRQNFEQVKEMNDSIQQRLTTFEVSIRDLSRDTVRKEDMRQFHHDIKDWFDKKRSDNFSICNRSVLDSISVLSALIYIVVNDNQRYKDTILKGISGPAIQDLKQADVQMVINRLVSAQIDSPDGLRSFLQQLQSIMMPLTMILKNLKEYVVDQHEQENDGQALVMDNPHANDVVQRLPNGNNLSIDDLQIVGQYKPPQQHRIPESHPGTSISIKQEHLRHHHIEKAQQQHDNMIRDSTKDIVKPFVEKGINNDNSMFNANPNQTEVICLSDLQDQQRLGHIGSQVQLQSKDQSQVKGLEQLPTQVLPSQKLSPKKQVLNLTTPSVSKRNDGNQQQLLIDIDDIGTLNDMSSQQPTAMNNPLSQQKGSLEEHRGVNSSANSMSSMTIQPSFKPSTQLNTVEQKPSTRSQMNQPTVNKDIKASLPASINDDSSQRTIMMNNSSAQSSKSIKQVEEERVSLNGNAQPISAFDAQDSNKANQDEQIEQIGQQLSAITNNVVIPSNSQQPTQNEKPGSSSKKQVQFTADTKPKDTQMQEEEKQSSHINSNDQQSVNANLSTDNNPQSQDSKIIQHLNRLKGVQVLAKKHAHSSPIDIRTTLAVTSYPLYEERKRRDEASGEIKMDFVQFFAKLRQRYCDSIEPKERYAKTINIFEKDDLDYGFIVIKLVAWLEDAALLDVYDSYGGMMYKWIVPTVNTEASVKLMKQAYDQFNSFRMKDYALLNVNHYNAIITHGLGIILQMNSVSTSFKPLSQYLMNGHQNGALVAKEKLLIVKTLLKTIGRLNSNQIYLNNLSLESILVRGGDVSHIQISLVDFRYALMDNNKLKEDQFPLRNVLTLAHIDDATDDEPKQSKYAQMNKQNCKTISMTNQLDLIALCQIILLVSDIKDVSNHYLGLYKRGESFPSVKNGYIVAIDTDFVGKDVFLKAYEYLYSKDTALKCELAEHLFIMYDDELKKIRLGITPQPQANDKTGKTSAGQRKAK